MTDINDCTPQKMTNICCQVLRSSLFIISRHEIDKTKVGEMFPVFAATSFYEPRAL